MACRRKRSHPVYGAVGLGPAYRLNRILKPYEVGSKAIRTSNGTARGFVRQDFEPVWERYIADAEQGAVTSPSPLLGPKRRDNVTVQA